MRAPRTGRSATDGVRQRSSRKATLIVAIVLSSTILAVPSPSHAAFYADNFPLVYSASNLPNGWTTFKIRSDGTHFALRVFGKDVKGPRQVAFNAYNDQGRYLVGFHYTAATQWIRQDGVLIDVHHEGNDFHMDTMKAKDPPGQFGMEANFNSVSTLPWDATFVVWWVADATWSIEIRSQRGEAANQVVAMRSGTEAFLYTTKDLAPRSTATVRPYVEGMGGNVQLGGQVSVDIQNLLIGGFVQGITNVGTQSMITPVGEKTCPRVVPELWGNYCWFSDISGQSVAGPGTYTLHNTGAGYGLIAGGLYEDVWFGGADVVLP